MRVARDIWEAALGELQLQISKPNYSTWLENTRGISYDDDLFVVGVPNIFVAEWLQNRLLSLIKRSLASIIGKSVNVQFLVQASMQTDAHPAPAYQADGGTSTRLAEPVKASALKSKYTFDTFVPGECNRMAYAAALGIAEEPAQAFNPLFIFGDTGVGKTHLLHAIERATRASGFRVFYARAEQFTSQFVLAVKSSKAEEFRHKFRDIDVLLFDDIQFLSGKAQTQECFFHVFNDLYDNGCQIAITCDCPPKALSSMGKRLKSRLEWGLIADIQHPSRETRLAILSMKARWLKMDISQEVLIFLAMQFKHNVRELEGALNRVVNYARLSGTSPDTSLAAQALADIATNEDRKETAILKPKIIINTVARYYDLSPEEIKGKRRDKKTALARQVVMYLLREQNHCRLSEIGDILGGRDHTTILHGCEKISTEIKSDSQLSKSIEEIRHQLNTGRKSA